MLYKISASEQKPEENPERVLLVSPVQRAGNGKANKIILRSEGAT